MSYSVLYSYGGVTKDISDFVSSIQYGGESQTAVRKMELSILSGTDTYIPSIEIKRGGLLILLSDGSELMRTVVFKEDKDDKGNIKITSYTHGIYLAKNKNSKKYTKQTASQIAQDICKEFEIPVGTIEDTKIILKSLILRDKTLWDMLLIALTETTKKSGVKYRVFFKEGKLNISAKSKQSTYRVIEKGVNLFSANTSSSVEEMKNKIVVIGRYPEDKNDAGLTYIVENTSMQKQYGLMQELQDESGNGLSKSDLKQIGDKMLKDLCKEETEAEIEALGIDEIESGVAVYVVESQTGLRDSFYVDQDDHTIEKNVHTMRLKLTRTDEVPKLEYEPPA